MEKCWINIKTAEAITTSDLELGKKIYCAQCPECKKYTFGYYNGDLLSAIPKSCPDCKTSLGVSETDL